jgi:hypothetical protein
LALCTHISSRGEQQAHLWLQFRDVVSHPHRHEQLCNR